MRRSKLMCHLAKKKEELNIGNISRGNLFDAQSSTEGSSTVGSVVDIRSELNPNQNSINNGEHSKPNDDSLQVESNNSIITDQINTDSSSSLGLGPDSDSDPEYMPDPVDESEEDEPFVKCRRANNNNRVGRKKINDDPPNDQPQVKLVNTNSDLDMVECKTYIVDNNNILVEDEPSNEVVIYQLESDKQDLNLLSSGLGNDVFDPNRPTTSNYEPNLDVVITSTTVNRGKIDDDHSANIVNNLFEDFDEPEDLPIPVHTAATEPEQLITEEETTVDENVGKRARWKKQDPKN